MKQLLIFLSVLLFVGCKKASTANTAPFSIVGKWTATTYKGDTTLNLAPLNLFFNFYPYDSIHGYTYSEHYNGKLEDTGTYEITYQPRPGLTIQINSTFCNITEVGGLVALSYSATNMVLNYSPPYYQNGDSVFIGNNCGVAGSIKYTSGNETFVKQ